MVQTDQEISPFFAGERKTLRFPVLDEDATPPTTPKVLTGVELHWGLVRQSDAGTFATSPLLVEKSTTEGSVTTENYNSTDDRVLVQLFRADTIDLPAGTYYWQLESEDGGGEPTMLATGTLVISSNLEESA